MFTGLRELVDKNNWKTGNGGVYFQFKRSLLLFQKYKLSVKLHR